jgi:2-polyprenyl-6-methoxyphenol hydroxylase-like FAD-dependent oxidoreductase
VGVVRKHFLEPTAGIKQEDGTYPYNGTWVAANLKMSLPSRETHPNLPLWDLGYKPEDVYDLFWPQGWHFCSPPGKATAAGRFGPHHERLWRHEFRQDGIDDTMDAEALLWEHLTPMITRERDSQGKAFALPVSYPRDCIEVLRCRPFRFTHKVVNRWFDNRTILIGDAAHVFPPFAGQGIASGLRDAHQLAWRLSLLVHRAGQDPKRLCSAKQLLDSWALERRRSVDDAAFLSMLIGRLCNKQAPLWAHLGLKLQMFLDWAGLFPRKLDPQAQKERRGFVDVPGGFLSKEYNGGGRMAQIHVWSSMSRAPVLSDTLLGQSTSVFTLVAIVHEESLGQCYDEAKHAIKNASFESSVLSQESIVLLSPKHITTSNCEARVPSSIEVFYPYLPEQNRKQGPSSNYDAGSYIGRLGHSTKFALVRADMFIFACARNTLELAACLGLLKTKLGH